MIFAQLPPDHWSFVTLSFVWGALWGSFLNVLVIRLPLGMSLSSPASHCFSCEKPIPFYHNIPLLSYLVLRGRCHNCRAPFSLRYFLIELTCGFLSLTLYRYLVFGSPDGAWAGILIPFVIYFVFILALLAVTFIDLDLFLIPNVITLPGIVLGLTLNLFFSAQTGIKFHHAFLGFFLGGGTILLLIEGYHWLTGREGMGGGDFKLMAMVGAFLGWQALPFLFFASSVQGVFFAVLLRVFRAVPKPPDYILATIDGEPLPESSPGDSESDGTSTADDEPGSSVSPSPESQHQPGEIGDGEVELDSALTTGGFGKMVLPFGPFIALAAIEYIFFGKQFIRWFQALTSSF